MFCEDKSCFNNKYESLWNIPPFSYKIVPLKLGYMSENSWKEAGSSCVKKKNYWKKSVSAEQLEFQEEVGILHLGNY